MHPQQRFFGVGTSVVPIKPCWYSVEGNLREGGGSDYGGPVLHGNVVLTVDRLRVGSLNSHQPSNNLCVRPSISVSPQ